METAEQLLARVTETYAKCATYADEGSHTTLFINGPQPWERRTTRNFFRTAFERGGRYLFEYRDQAVGPESEWARGAIWQDATVVRTWSTLQCVTGTPATVSDATAALAGVSGGTSAFALCLLLPELAKAPRFPTTELSVVEGNPAGESRSCFLVGGKDWQGKAETLWIERESALVVRLEKTTIFDKAHFASQLASMQAALAAMPADHKHRPMMEKMVTEDRSREHHEFQTESTTIWHPRINVAIPDEAFVFVPPN